MRKIQTTPTASDFLVETFGLSDLPQKDARSILQAFSLTPYQRLQCVCHRHFIYPPDLRPFAAYCLQMSVEASGLELDPVIQTLIEDAKKEGIDWGATQSYKKYKRVYWKHDEILTRNNKLGNQVTPLQKWERYIYLAAFELTDYDTGLIPRLVVKYANWRPSRTEREKAELAQINLLLSLIE